MKHPVVRIINFRSFVSAMGVAEEMEASKPEVPEKKKLTFKEQQEALKASQAGMVLSSETGRGLATAPSKS